MVATLILSNQRTGSTALLDFLELFGKSVYHEPFNQNRVWHNEFINYRDNKLLTQNLKNKLDQKTNIIKITTETLSHEFNIELINYMMKIKAPLLFLFRRNEKDRIRSLKKALVSGNWFFNQTKPGYKREISKNKIKKLSKKTIKCNEIYLDLTEGYNKKQIIFYEDLFDQHNTLPILLDIFSLLRIQVKNPSEFKEILINFKTSDKNIQ